MAQQFSLAVWLSLVAVIPTVSGEDRIRVNTVGYQPFAQKIATIDAPCKEAFVESVADSSREIGVRVRLSPYRDGAAVIFADFSDLQTPGTYRLVVPSVGKSPPFKVGESVYNQPFYAAMRGMYLWRCGAAVTADYQGDVFHHEACHLHDGLLDQVGQPDEHRDGTGGWHDAGDYNKYTVNGAFAAGMMLHAWERFEPKLNGLGLDLPESNNQTPDFLDEVRWELQWLLKMQAQDGRVYHKLSTLKFGGFILPEDETTPRYFCPWGSAATADFAGVMALAARCFQPYDSEFSQRCLTAARLSFAFLESHPDDHQPDQSAFKTGPYDAHDKEHRPWAAAELWETTGEQHYLEAYEQYLANAAASSPGPTYSLIDLDWDWKNVRNLGAYTYLASKRSGRDPDLLERMREDLVATAESLVTLADRHPYGRPLGTRYYWGGAGTVARVAMTLHHAFIETGDERYVDTLRDGLNHLLGRNPYGRSYMTGVGHRPPQEPHCRRSEGDSVDAPWPGYLIGGPNPKATDWRDVVEDYRTNEICVNWNGALIFALASQVEPATFHESIKPKQAAKSSQ